MRTATIESYAQCIIWLIFSNQAQSGRRSRRGRGSGRSEPKFEKSERVVPERSVTAREAQRLPNMAGDHEAEAEALQGLDRPP